MAPSFARTLLRWYDANARALPWVGETDPYKVWLSEIILQQTRVEQGTAYYLRFIEAFPTVRHLAEAPETRVLKLWEGLGYYSRARNLHATAQLITREHGGRFPDTLEGLLHLRGIGNYTARAILSYAFRKPYAVADGNVLRILSRYRGISEPIDKPAGRNKLEALADELLDPARPHLFNQAMMDLGATVCKPRNPDCDACPFRKTCHAAKHGVTHLLPVKSAKTPRTKRYFAFFILKGKGKIALQQRTGSGIWRNLWQFPATESDRQYTLSQLRKSTAFAEAGIPDLPYTKAGTEKQILTHRELHCTFYVAEVADWRKVHGPDWKIVETKNLHDHAFPGAIRTFLQRNLYF